MTTIHETDMLNKQKHTASRSNVANIPSLSISTFDIIKIHIAAIITNIANINNYLHRPFSQNSRDNPQNRNQ